jgi:lycopene cyclase domain-containing protein
MTYFGFLVRFLIPPIVLLLALAAWEHRRGIQAAGFPRARAVWAAIGLHVFLAVAYTTPWDNYLVATGVWYYNPRLVTGLLIGYVPIEEYTFFVLESILAGLWWWFLARRLPPPTQPFQPNRSFTRTAALVLGILWLASAGLLFFGAAAFTYLSITLFWALPPMVLQAFFGADLLWRRRGLVAWAALVPSLYLSAVDVLALKDTTWSISASQTTGVLFFGILPLEEGVFFFVTSVLLAFGMTLLLAPESRSRLAEFKARRGRSPGRGSTSSTGSATR